MKVTTTVVPPPRDPVHHFAKWVASSCDVGAQVLNVGAGSNVSGRLRPLLRRQPHLVGVDPDNAIHRNNTLTDGHQMTLEEFAASTKDRFDVVLAVYVLEHVESPETFARAAAGLLRPGGSFFGLTLNVRQYFGAATWALSRAHAAERTLHWLKGDHLVHEHHFPTVYRCNSTRAVRRHWEAAGFSSLEFRCYDAPERYQWYFPDRLRWLPPAYSWFAYAVGAPSLMGHLTFRATMPADAADHTGEPDHDDTRQPGGAGRV